jgi:hypothetical protein
VLRLVESDRNKRAQWVAVTLPQDAPIPIAEEVGEGVGELTIEAEERENPPRERDPAQPPTSRAYAVNTDSPATIAATAARARLAAIAHARAAPRGTNAPFLRNPDPP